MMQANKNLRMLQLSAAALLFNLLICAGSRFVPFLSLTGHWQGFEVTPVLMSGQYVLACIPFVLWGGTVYVFARHREHPALPWLSTLTLTFTSFAMMGESGGEVVFYFSIFLVIAAVAYYDSIRLIFMVTLLFAVQHVVGYVFIPQLVFGADSYSLLMLFIHALFVVLTSSSTILQIRSKQSIARQMEEEQKSKESQQASFQQRVQMLSEHIRSASQAAADKSEANVRTHQEMSHVYEEVIGGLGSQIYSIEQIEVKLLSINSAIQSALESSLEMRSRSLAAVQALTANQEKMRVLQQYHRHMLQLVGRTLVAMHELQQPAARTRGTGSKIQELSGQSLVTAEEIQAAMECIYAESEMNILYMERGQEIIQRSASLVDDFVADFIEMREMTEQLLQDIVTIDQWMGAIKLDASAVACEMSDIASIIGERMVSMEELVAMSENHVSSAEQIDTELSNLHQLSHKLQQQLLTT
ncbi:hypothetical protein WMW72_27425 [Paenibacillus filicis]|uniref:Methyl-accepting transducer domain-containing protein n=1 Tax=Paenibacillus filicis TaxID=669464 RepID=A0ABU9DS27_9BACL